MYTVFYDASSISDHVMSAINSLVNDELERVWVKEIAV